MKRAVERAGLDFEKPERPDKMRTRELLTNRYKKQYPNDVFKVIGWLHRYYLPKPNMFEFPDGELDADHTVKQVLVYFLNEYVDNQNIEDGPIGYHAKMGWYPSPLVKNKHVVVEGIEQLEIDHIGDKNIFYIPYNKENLNKILSQMYNQPTDLGVAIARERGPDLRDRVYSVHNMQEFAEVDDIEGLIAASSENFLKKEYGGYHDYLDSREESKKKTTRENRRIRE